MTNTERYDEDLALRPLPDGKLVTAFTFTTLLGGASPRDPRDSETSGTHHYTFFPLTLGQLLREYAVTELHLSLNAGKWSYDAWGYPDHPSVGTGAELWAWMADGGPLSCVSPLHISCDTHAFFHQRRRALDRSAQRPRRLVLRLPRVPR